MKLPFFRRKKDTEEGHSVPGGYVKPELVDDYTLSGASLAYRVERFVARNWVKVFSWMFAAVIALVFVSVYSQISASRQIEKMEKILHDHLNKVLVATPDGRIVAVAREEVNAQFLRAQIRLFVMNYLILDKFDLGGEAGRFPGSFKELLQQENIRMLFDFVDESAKKQFVSYLKYLYSLALADKLPEVIRPVNVSDEKYNVEGNQFTYEGVYDCVLVYVDVSQQWVQAAGRIKVALEGYFMPEKGSEVNPYGLRITKLKVSYVKKPS